jgi:F-type H+-transporting ATPase subunit delta
MDVTIISKRYAQALFDLALEMNRLERISDDVKLIQEVIAENPQFRRLLKSPVIPDGKKSSILKAVFGRHIDELTFRFLLLVTRKEREVFLKEITGAFMIIYKKHHNIVTVKLTTPVAFDDKTRKDLLEMLHRDLHQKIELIEVIDPNMLGGFIITLDDKKYDASIRRQLDRLYKSFEDNLYVRGF